MPGPTRSLKAGITPDLRKVIDSALAANSDPITLGDDTGALSLAALGQYAAIDCIADAAVAGSSFDLDVWWWYAVAGLYVHDDVIGTVSVTEAGGTSAFPILNTPRYPCADGVYIEVSNFVGVGATADVWLAGRQENN